MPLELCVHSGEENHELWYFALLDSALNDSVFGEYYGFCYPVNRLCLDCRLLTFSLRALFQRFFTNVIALHHCLRKVCDGPIRHGVIHRASSVVAEQRGWDSVALW